MNTSVKTLVVDHERSIRESMISLIRDRTDFKIVGECDSGEEAVTAINSLYPDLIFLEVQLPDLDGFTVVEKIRLPRTPMIVFTSDSEDHAFKAYEFCAFDYILKPLRIGRFERTLIRVREQCYRHDDLELNRKINALYRYIHDRKQETTLQTQPNVRFFPVKSGGKISLVKSENILYIEASGYYSQIVTRSKKYLIRATMSEVLEKLDPQDFLRIHRSSIINLNHVREIQRSGQQDYIVLMQDEKVFKISKSYKQEIFDRLII